MGSVMNTHIVQEPASEELKQTSSSTEGRKFDFILHLYFN